mmetsp:Transcript_2352/g.4666  ORF Transcript_2352/g.4666 Transcript_2352/m.4666 type:complete len:120 (+) Transcript_2352:462-821(+)
MIRGPNCQTVGRTTSHEKKKSILVARLWIEGGFLPCSIHRSCPEKIFRTTPEVVAQPSFFVTFTYTVWAIPYRNKGSCAVEIEGIWITIFGAKNFVSQRTPRDSQCSLSVQYCWPKSSP